MEAHFQLSDKEFESAFEELSINPELFTHEAHLRLAWIHITKFGIGPAIENVCRQINAFASSHGDHDKYNETVTVAAVLVVYHFVLNSNSQNFREFIKEIPRLKYKFNELLDSHYSWDIFKSVLAKKQYMEPDKQPFDKIV